MSEVPLDGAALDGNRCSLKLIQVPSTSLGTWLQNMGALFS